MSDNSLKEAEFLFETLKTKFNNGSLKLFNHQYKRKYVDVRELTTYQGFKVNVAKCSMERYTSHIFCEENKGLNRDGWEFNIVGNFNGSNYESTIKLHTWFKNRHKNYGTLVHESGWNCSPYLNINNFGVEFELPTKVLIEDWIEPHKLPQNKNKKK